MNFFDTPVTDWAKKRVQACLDSGLISEGELVREFESELSDFFGYYDPVTVNSGTSALHLALVLSGVEKGDEVILPAQTFVSTGLAVLYCGARPVFADIEVETGNLNYYDVERKVTRNTRAIIAVAWGGLPPKQAGLAQICRDLKIKLIVDNAHALGAKIEYEDFSCFSFQAIKQLTTGDGGMLVCRRKEDSERARRLRWFGIDRERDLPDETGERAYNLKEVGYKYHMSNLSAALGLGNLDGFRLREALRHGVAEFYEKNLFELSIEREGSTDWLYTILVQNRSNFLKMMKEKKIPVSVAHVGIDRNEIFGGKRNLPVQRHWDERHVCLPCHASLTNEDIEKVVDAVKGGW